MFSFLIFGTSGHVHDRQKPSLFTFDTQNNITSNIPRKFITTYGGGHYFPSSQKTNRHRFEKYTCRKSLRPVSSYLENGCGITIFQKPRKVNPVFNSIRGIPPTHPPCARSNQHSDQPPLHQMHQCINIVHRIPY